MSPVEAAPRELPPIGQRRLVTQVRTGWHIQVPDGAWRLVTGVGVLRGGEILLSVSVGLHDEDALEYRKSQRLETRTPEEQIQFIESQRLEHVAQDGRGGFGPVSRIHYEDQIVAELRAARNVVGRRPCETGEPT